MNKKTTIIFDFDGTLANTLSLVIEISNELAEKYKFKKVTLDEMPELQNKSYRDIMKFMGISMLKLPMILWKGREEMSKKIKFIQSFAELPGVLKELKNKGYHLAVLTSNSVENVQSFVRHSDIDIFDFICSEKNLFGKDKALEKALEQFKLTKEEVIYVGDEVRDIEACKKIGIDIISVTWGFNGKEILQQYNPTYLVHTPHELLNIFARV